MTEHLVTTIKIIPFLPRAFRWIKRKTSVPIADWWARRKLAPQLEVVREADGHLPVRADARLFGDIYELGGGFLPTSTETSLRVLEERHRANPDIYTALVPSDQPGAGPVAYYVLLPLSPAAQAGLRNETIRSSRDLRVEDITKPTATLEAIYISAVFGMPGAQVAVSKELLDKIANLRSTSGLRYIFTRPTTSAGRAFFQALTHRRPNRDSRLEIIDLEEFPDALTRISNRRERAKRLSQRKQQRGKTAA